MVRLGLWLGLWLGLVWYSLYSQGNFVVRVGIRVMPVLGLPLVSSRLCIILCQLLYGPLYYVLVIYSRLK